MKKILITVGSIIGLAVLVPHLLHNQFVDYVNPYIKMETSYAQVPKNTQKYYHVQAVDKSGKKLPYKIDYVGGNDPSQQYIAIHHKGQYVKVIDYIPKRQMPTVRQ